MTKVLYARTTIKVALEHSGWLNYDGLPVIDRNGVYQNMLWYSAIAEDEQRALVEDIDRKELVITRGALAEAFWIRGGAFLWNHSARPSQSDTVD